MSDNNENKATVVVKRVYTGTQTAEETVKAIIRAHTEA